MKQVTVSDKIQQDYVYQLTEPAGKNFDSEFKPELTPKEMLSLDVFGGKYMNDCRDEFPADWFVDAKLSPQGKDISLNYFSVAASQPLEVSPVAQVRRAKCPVSGHLKRRTGTRPGE